MRLRFGNRVFAPGLLASLVTLALLIVLIGLGRWQLERMHEKEVLFQAFEAGGRSSVDLDSLDGEGRRFQRVTASGRYQSGRQILLDNLTHAGRVGFQVLTPFATDGGRTVLVNRGWIPAGATRDARPEVSVDESHRTIAGRLRELPRAGIELKSRPDASGPWPRVMSYPRIEQVRAALGTDVGEMTVLLDAGEADGFERAWRPTTFPPERHLGYAVTWFGLALTLLVAFVIVNLETQTQR